jgi:hypothetical protein
MKLYKYLRVLDISAGFATYQLLLFDTKWFCLLNDSSASGCHLLHCPGICVLENLKRRQFLLNDACCGAAAFFVEKPWEKPWEKTKSWTQPRRKILMRAYKTFCRSAHANIILLSFSERGSCMMNIKQVLQQPCNSQAQSP